MRLRHTLLAYLPGEWPEDSWQPYDLATLTPPGPAIHEQLLRLASKFAQATAKATS